MTEVYKAIAAVQGELAKTGIAKDGKNEQQRYRFRGIDAVYNALAPLLASHGLCILPRVLSREVTERVTKSGTPLFYVCVDVEFDFVAAKDGSMHTVRTSGEAMDSADKATNKAMSAAYKYAAFMAFAIPTEGDNDADGVTHEVAATPAAQPAKTQPEKLKGPITTRAALRIACGTFVRELKACGDDAMLQSFLDENRALVRQVEEEAEFFWLGDGADFAGMKKEIEEQVALVGADDSWKTNVLRAG